MGKVILFGLTVMNFLPLAGTHIFYQKCFPATADRRPALLASAALGAAALEMVARLTAPLFPLRDTERDGARATNYLWTYAVTCECGEQSFLARRRWLSKKRGLHLNDAHS